MTLWRPPRSGAAMLICLAAAIETCLLIVGACAQSLHQTTTGDHRLLLLLGLFFVMFLIHLRALRLALRMPAERISVRVIVAVAVVFRMTALFSNPIEEIDLYRYLWDGQVTRADVSPYRFSPRQVSETAAGDDIPEDLRRLVQARDASPANAVILSRIHFPQLPTIYPPVSQAVFAAAVWTTPPLASVYWRMVAMKAWFVMFDVGTILVLVHVLRLTGRHAGWLIAYAWCPLVIKEIANSGHVDAVASFLTVVAVAAAVHAVGSPGRPWRRVFSVGLCVGGLALGVGAKLYPVVLLPLVVWSVSRQHGPRTAVLSTVAFAGIGLFVLWPLVPVERLDAIPQSPEPFPPPQRAESADLPPVPPLAAAVEPRDPSQSLRAFLSQWEMNDFLFMLLVENLRPAADLRPEKRAWFAATPEHWRAAVVHSCQALVGQPADCIPFLVTRVLLSVIFAGMAVNWAQRAARSADPAALPQAAFATLAWFWLLLPTANPWYLVWALPFLPFATRPAWLALSGLALMYYLRFWFSAQFPTAPACGTRYSGAQFFDFIVTWLEFAPFLAALGADWWMRPCQQGS